MIVIEGDSLLKKLLGPTKKKKKRKEFYRLIGKDLNSQGIDNHNSSM